MFRYPLPPSLCVTDAAPYSVWHAAPSPAIAVFQLHAGSGPERKQVEPFGRCYTVHFSHVAAWALRGLPAGVGSYGRTVACPFMQPQQTPSQPRQTFRPVWWHEGMKIAAQNGSGVVISPVQGPERLPTSVESIRMLGGLHACHGTYTS